MSDEKLITVITTVYNKAAYLKTWAISVASQTYLDKARVLVIDDGSTDESLALVKKYAAEYSIPVDLVVHEKNCGLLYTILEAYRLLDTKYFTLLDADDYWLTERKLEKAITFLETHEDYSAYFSNYLREVNGGKNTFEFPADAPSQTFNGADELPDHFIQTAATVFRNFFTPELLSKMELASRGKKVHVCETDNFRNYLAFRFGKVYFENSIDALWRINIGVFGKLTILEKYLDTMQEYWQLAEFYKRNFGTDRNARQAVVTSVSFYRTTVKIFADMLENCTLFEFRGGKYFRDRFRDYGDTDVEKAVNALLEQAEIFSRYDFKLDGDSFSMNIRLDEA